MKHFAVALASLTLLVIALLAVNQYLDDGDEPARSSAGAVNAVPGTPLHAAPSAAFEVDASPSDRVQTEAATGAAGASRDMQQRLRAADLGRPFFQWAMAHPEQGGAYYAQKLAAQCKGVVYRKALLSESNRAYPPGTDTQAYQHKIAAIEQLRRRCGDMAESELDDVLRQTAPAEVQGRDPLLNIAHIWDAQASRDERARKAQALFVAQLDPMLADELGAKLFRARQPGTIYFDGREWSLTDTPVVTTALYLLPCELGMDCSAQKDFGLAAACSSGGACHASREEKALREMVNGNLAELAEALALSRKMAAALRSKDPTRLARGS